MFEPFLKLEDVVLKTIESLKNFFITRISYINNTLCFLKKVNQITIKSYNSLENSVENFSSNKENISDICTINIFVYNALI